LFVGRVGRVVPRRNDKMKQHCSRGTTRPTLSTSIRAYGGGWEMRRGGQG